MLKNLDHVDSVRRELAPKISQKQKSALGQFMTPSSVARFMASLFTRTALPVCRLLDAGAGVGSLSSAFLDRWASGGFSFERIEVEAFEIDDTLRVHLAESLAGYSERLAVHSRIEGGDFIEHAVNRLQFETSRFSHAILNPPYKKINTDSRHRQLLRAIGIETVNMYSAFVALALAMMEENGQLVAIIPRSFCNGPYYRPFRDFLFRHAAIRHMHLFAARDKAFSDDAVLQENIIIFVERGRKQSVVTVSTSTDDSLGDYQSHEYPFDRIVLPNDPERFIHVPTSPDYGAIERCRAISHSLKDLGISVSTGPVVDFRMRSHLRDKPESGTVPLLYPGHFTSQGAIWPNEEIRKPNAIAYNLETEKWLYPSGFYTVVRRFSSKEERRRIVASVVEPARFAPAKSLGFENHLNVFHDCKRGLPEDLARGLATFLNTTAVDDYFRRFNGHTQVNATDLRLMKYPSREQLILLGKWTRKQRTLDQDLIDKKLAKLDV